MSKTRVRLHLKTPSQTYKSRVFCVNDDTSESDPTQTKWTFERPFDRHLVRIDADSYAYHGFDDPLELELVSNDEKSTKSLFTMVLPPSFHTQLQRLVTPQKCVTIAKPTTSLEVCVKPLNSTMITRFFGHTNEDASWIDMYELDAMAQARYRDDFYADDNFYGDDDDDYVVHNSDLLDEDDDDVESVDENAVFEYEAGRPWIIEFGQNADRTLYFKKLVFCLSDDDAL
jgi:hypothetical protein